VEKSLVGVVATLPTTDVATGAAFRNTDGEFLRSLPETGENGRRFGERVTPGDATRGDPFFASTFILGLEIAFSTIRSVLEGCRAYFLVLDISRCLYPLNKLIVAV
jgi:hypothetical protein